MYMYQQELSLLPAKLLEICLLLESWHLWKKCTKCQLLSLIGWPQRVASFRDGLMYSSTSPPPHLYYVYVYIDARANIEWWRNFLPAWNVSLCNQLCSGSLHRCLRDSQIWCLLPRRMVLPGLYASPVCSMVGAVCDRRCHLGPQMEW